MPTAAPPGAVPAALFLPRRRPPQLPVLCLPPVCLLVLFKWLSRLCPAPPCPPWVGSAPPRTRSLSPN